MFLGPASSAAPELTSALRKLIRALPATLRSDAEAAASAVVPDSARWGERGQVPGLVEFLQPATAREVKVRLTYAGRDERSTVRLVDPLGLVDKDGIWYLIAGTESGRRTLRVDRVAKAEAVDLPAERPADFSLSAEWARVVEGVEPRRSLVSAVVLINARLFPVLRTHFGRQCHVIGQEDARVRARVAAHLVPSIAEQLARLGASVEVVEPASVRAELVRIGLELAERYASAGDGAWWRRSG